MGRKKIKPYVPEALENFGKDLMKIRQYHQGKSNNTMLQVRLDGLEKAVQALPKNDRERIERFWGLTGGTNHSKKLNNKKEKDIAYKQMMYNAITSMRILLTLDYMIMYDGNLNTIIELISRKVKSDRLEISNVEITKLLMAYFIYIENGPKMPFEEEPLSIDDKLDSTLLFDEYEVLRQISEAIKDYQDKSINLQLLNSLFEMMNLRDRLEIRKSMSLESDESTQDVEIIRSVNRIREFKERVFPYGPWEVTCALILGNNERKINLEGFCQEFSEKSVDDWPTKVEKFKTGHQKTLRVSKDIRVLDIYSVGGLEFTDPQEIDFLYLYGDMIL